MKTKTKPGYLLGDRVEWIGEDTWRGARGRVTGMREPGAFRSSPVLMVEFDPGSPIARVEASAAFFRRL